MNILHLEDNANDAELVRVMITQEWPDCRITCVSTRPAFVGELERAGYDLILSDSRLDSLNGMEALTLAREHVPDTPFIFLSGTIGEDRAIEALRAGAQDYVLKDRMKRLNPAIARAVHEGEQHRKHRQAESRLRDQAQMLNQAREAIFITDLEHRLLSWSAGAERLYGWKAEEVIGRLTGELFEPPVRAAMEAARDAAFAQGQWMGELRMHNRVGEPLVVESRQTLIRDEADRPKARLCIDSDITDRKKLEEQFLRAQRMENVGLLAAGIAHDLNNMLAPILLAAPMLRDHVSDVGALRLLTTLERSAERGANLVRQILAFAQGANGEHRLLQVKHLLRDIASVIGGTFPKSITLEDFVPGDLWPIKGNATQIHQVLLNLAVNARDAMPNGGTLRLRAENCTLDEASAAGIEGGRVGAFLVLLVEDTGTGIPPEVRQKMWQPFYTTKEADKGTGLGLSTVRGIVENHEGFIDLKTTVGRGTAFRIYLPAVENVPADRAPAPSRPLRRGQGELILVVDDEQHIREMTSTMLTRAGYRVMLAADGSEAVLVFAERAAEIRLVITDLHMPHLDGATLGRALRRINPSARLLVVSGLTSSLGGGSQDYQPNEFADGFLHKPFKPEALLAKVNEVLATGTTTGSGRSLPPFATA